MSKKILIMDDEKIVADTLAIIFSKNGFECRVSYTATEALIHVDTFCPDLLVCDVTMPDMNGLDAASTILKRCPYCRVIVLTGQYSNLAPARAWAKQYPGSAKVLTKPLMPDVLLREVLTMLGR